MSTHAGSTALQQVPARLVAGVVAGLAGGIVFGVGLVAPHTGWGGILLAGAVYGMV